MRCDRSPAPFDVPPLKNDDVAGIERAAHGELERNLFVGEGAKRDRLAAGFAHGRGDDGAVAVVNAGRPQRLAGLDQFIAGRQHGHARPAHHIDRRKPAGCEHADLSRANPGAAAQQGLAARNIGAGVRNKLPGRRRPFQFDRGRGTVIEQLGLFDHHHGVGAARNDAAGGDRRRGAGRHFDRRLDAAGDHFGIERKPLACAIAGTRGIGGAHGKAVDIGTVERRRIDRRNDVGGKNTRQRGSKRLTFRGKRRPIDASLETPPRFVRRDHFEKLLLARRAADRIENGRAALFLIYDHGFTATSVPC